MIGKDVIEKLRKKLEATSDADLAARLGVTVQSIRHWKKRPSVTPRQIAGLVKSASKASAITLQTTAIRPLVEFCRISKLQKRKKHGIFSTKNHRGEEHAYMKGLRDELDTHKGVYIFFDSRGQAIYAGKARKQTLWTEINLAFNRARGDIQKIRRVKHPKLGFPYRTSKEKSRQIVEEAVPLHELAHYFSAYEVVDGMIGEVEALLVRSFANDLLNIRMERFDRQRPTARTR